MQPSPAPAGDRRQDIARLLLVAGIYTGALILFYWRIIFTSDYGIPFDAMDSHFTAQSFFSRWLRKGIFPLWNPHITLGYPIAGDVALSPFYPITLLSYLFPIGRPFHFKVLEVFLLLHVLIGGLSVHALCRHLKLAFAPALLGGLAFMFAGFFPMRLPHEVWVKTAAWVPLVLLLFMRTLERRRRRDLIACSAVFTLMILAGHWQTCLYTAYLLGAWLLWTRRRLFEGLRQLITVGLLACGLGAIQIVPAIELLRHSARQSLTLEDSAQGAVDLRSLPTLLFPDLYRTAEADISSHFGDPTLIHLYCGVFVLALAFIGARASSPAPRQRNFFTVLAVAAFLLALGTQLPLYGFAYHLLPGFALFRRPYSFWFFVVLSLSVLAACGLQALLTARDSDRRFIHQTARAGVFVLLLLLAGWAVFEWTLLSKAGLRSALKFVDPAPFALARVASHAVAVMMPFWLVLWALLRLAEKRRLPALMGAVMVAAVLADLYFFNANRIFNTARMNVSELVTDRRILGNPMPGEGALGHSGSGWYRVALANFGGIFENAGDIMGFESFGGYNPIRLRTYTDFAALINGPNSPLLDLANVKYVLSSPGFQTATPPAGELDVSSPVSYRFFLRSGGLSPDKYTFVGSTVANRYQLFENRTVLPRHFGVSRVVSEPDASRQLEQLRRGFNFYATAIVESVTSPKTGNCAALSFQIVDRTPNLTKLSVSSPGPCLLVSSEMWYPGWKAYLNGREIPMLRANYAFRAIELPVGRHEVAMRYRPASVLVGAIITLASLLVGGGLLVRNARREALPLA